MLTKILNSGLIFFVTYICVYVSFAWLVVSGIGMTLACIVAILTGYLVSKGLGKLVSHLSSK